MKTGDNIKYNAENRNGTPLILFTELCPFVNSITRILSAKITLKPIKIFSRNLVQI